MTNCRGPQQVEIVDQGVAQLDENVRQHADHLAFGGAFRRRCLQGAVAYQDHRAWRPLDPQPGGLVS